MKLFSLFLLVLLLVMLGVLVAGHNTACHQQGYLTGHAPRCDELSLGTPYGCSPGDYYNSHSHCCFKLPNYASCGVGQHFNYGRRCCENNHHSVLIHRQVRYVPHPHYHRHHGCCRWGHRHCCRRRWSFFG